MAPVVMQASFLTAAHCSTRLAGFAVSCQLAYSRELKAFLEVRVRARGVKTLPPGEQNEFAPSVPHAVGKSIQAFVQE